MGESENSAVCPRRSGGLPKGLAAISAPDEKFPVRDARTTLARPDGRAQRSRLNQVAMWVRSNKNGHRPD